MFKMQRYEEFSKQFKIKSSDIYCHDVGNYSARQLVICLAKRGVHCYLRIVTAVFLSYSISAERVVVEA